MATTTVTITVTTPTGVTIQNVLDTLSTYWGYQATLPDGTSNPQTKAQFVQARVAQYLRDNYIAAKVAADVDSTRVTSNTTASQVTVT